jgi:hypothetical protein
MRDSACGLRRMILPRTPVNKDEKKGRGCYAPALALCAPDSAREFRLSFSGTGQEATPGRSSAGWT